MNGMLQSVTLWLTHMKLIHTAKVDWASSVCQAFTYEMGTQWYFTASVGFHLDCYGGSTKEPYGGNDLFAGIQEMSRSSSGAGKSGMVRDEGIIQISENSAERGKPGKLDSGEIKATALFLTI